MTVRFSHALILFLVSLGYAIAHADDEIPTTAQELARFDASPREFLNAPPTRFRPGGALWRAARTTPFEAKLDLRRRLVPPLPPVTEPDTHDEAAQITNLKFTRVSELDELRSASVALAPWSGDYWGVYKGGLGRRYADPLFPNHKDWKRNYDYLVSRLGAGDAAAVLSPAEKYDLLTGDPDWTLTRRMQEEGWQYYVGPNTVPRWVGYCHGWAAAAYAVPRPKFWIEMLSADGIKIPFYPDDIKALETVVWADYVLTHPIRFAGARCETSHPAQDANGRILDPGCFDSNPATWHLAVMNRVGVEGKPFTFDASLDEEVWNQPVVSYKIGYFNPKTLLPVANLKDALVSIERFPSDRFKSYRSARAKDLVGISMELTYVDETTPSNKPTDGERDDERVTVRYLYDLELDEGGRVIGGEWYRNKHPDFLWRPYEGERPGPGGLPDAAVVDELNRRSRARQAP